MRIITSRTSFQIDENTAVVIGKFDGVHLGHQVLLKEIIAAKEHGLKATAFTFDPSPAVFFGLEDDVAITTKEEKRKILANMGIDYLVEYPINEQTAKIDPVVFIEKYLCKYLNAKYVVCGDDLSFGYKGKGNYNLLKKYSGIYGYKTKEISKICYDGDVISSSRIRAALKKGDMQSVTDMIGRPYSFISSIVHGNQIGRKIGFPTINMMTCENKMLPPLGVYYSVTEIKGQRYNGITNIGYKPTVSNNRIIGIETFLYDFNSDVYGENAVVEIMEFKRKEQKFKNIEDLKEQLKNDILDGRRYHF